MKTYYLDSAATTSVSPIVFGAMAPYFTTEYGNPGSGHEMGRVAAEAVDLARDRVAEHLGCQPEEVIFTSGGTEGNNLVILGLRERLKAAGRTHIIVSRIEHKSVLKAADVMAKSGFKVSYIDPNPETGCVEVDDLAKMITRRTGLISVMCANNETGVWQPVSKIAELCTERGVLFHSDCVQAAWHCNLRNFIKGVDFATISGHKIHGPKGVGAVMAREKGLLTPIIHGGSAQEFGLRGGTENVPGIVGLGVACEEASADYYMSYYEEACERVMDAVLEKFPDAKFPYCDDGLVHKTFNITFPKVDNDTLIRMLDRRGVFCSAGSACNSREVVPSHVLTACGFSPEEARSTIRISLSNDMPMDDLEEAAGIIGESAALLRSLADES